MLMIERDRQEMGAFYDICIGLTLGVLIGFGAGGLKWAFGSKSYSEETSDNH